MHSVTVQFRFVRREELEHRGSFEKVLFFHVAAATKVDSYFDQRNAFPRFSNRLTTAPTAVTALSCTDREIEGNSTEKSKGRANQIEIYDRPKSRFVNNKWTILSTEKLKRSSVPQIKAP